MLQFGVFVVFEQPGCLGKYCLSGTLRSAEPAVIGEYAECKGTAVSRQNSIGLCFDSLPAGTSRAIQAALNR